MSADAASNQPAPELLLAKWSDRFFAWLIDFIIVNIAVGAVLAAAAFPFWLDYGPDRWFGFGQFDGPLRYFITSSAFFGYWTFFESTRGQSIGKMVLKLKVVDLQGKAPETRNIAIQSFGKAFLLPIDTILGWIFTNEKRQRIFNRASDTLVIKLQESYGAPGTLYKKD
jgi:uncharacterized RDD family membrane protein YckC